MPVSGGQRCLPVVRPPAPCRFVATAQASLSAWSSDLPAQACESQAGDIKETGAVENSFG